MSLNDILKKPDVLSRVRNHPDTFRFTEEVSLVVTGGHWPPHLLVTEGEEPGTFSMEGPMFSLLEALAEAMNFSYTLTRPPDGYWGAPLANGTWTGMVGQIHRKEADLALGPFALTEARAEAATMTKAVFFDKLCIIGGRGRPESDPWGFLLPLAPAVWLALLLGMLLTCASFAALGEGGAEDRGLLRAAGVLFMHVRSLLQQGLRRDVQPARARLVVGGWLLAAMLVTWSYSGNLASLLTVRHVAQPVQGLGDIVGSEDTVVVMEPDTAFTELFAKTESKILRQIDDLKRIDRMLYFPFEYFYELMDDDVRGGDCVIITTVVSADLLFGEFFTNTGGVFVCGCVVVVVEIVNNNPRTLTSRPKNLTKVKPKEKTNPVCGFLWPKGVGICGTSRWKCQCDFYKAREEFLPIDLGMLVQKDMPLVGAINSRVHRIVETGLYDRWVSDAIVNSTACTAVPSVITVQEPLSVNSVWGMLVILSFGLAASFVVFIIELLFGQFRMGE
ncbi:probable glutamate receptor [Penaeus vannamei]|uniref:probable glutamate receptor n=1 Tax=Penaeus vannamei TaxID=6689 RepID=UPI00387F4CE2